MPTVVMVRDVAAGQLLTRDDVEVAARPAGQRPGSALSALESVVGRAAAAPLVAHEVVTQQRLVGGGLLAGQPTDRVAISVPVLDVSSTGVAAGTRIDLYATGSGALAASDVVVLAVHDAEEATGLGVATPPQVTLALDPRQAGDVARALSALEAGQSLVVAIRRPGAVAQ